MVRDGRRSRLRLGADDLGLLYTHGGDGLPQDYDKAIDWFRKAADKDDPDAKYDLGWAYEAGLGVPRIGTRPSNGTAGRQPGSSAGQEQRRPTERR